MIRVLVPLVVTDEQMDEALDVLQSALQTVSEKEACCRDRDHVAAEPSSAIRAKWRIRDIASYVFYRKTHALGRCLQRLSIS